MYYAFRGGFISKTWILGTMMQLLMDMPPTKADQHSAKNNENHWTPNTFFADSYVVRYTLPNQNASTTVVSSTKAKSPQGRALRDNYTTGFDYSRYPDYYQDDKAVPVNPNEPSSSIPAGPTRPGSPSSIIASSFPSSNLQFPQSYPYPSSGGYYYQVSPYLPPPPSPQFWLPSQNFQTFDYGSQYPPGNTTSGLEMNTENQFIVQPSRCSNSIAVDRTRDIEVHTSVKYDSNQTGVCMIMLYGTNEYNRLAISLAEQRTINATPSGTWLETNVKLFAVQGEDIQLIDTKSHFGTNSFGLILTKSNIVVLSLYIDRAIDFFLDITTYQSSTC